MSNTPQPSRLRSNQDFWANVLVLIGLGVTVVCSIINFFQAREFHQVEVGLERSRISNENVYAGIEVRPSFECISDSENVKERIIIKNVGNKSAENVNLAISDPSASITEAKVWCAPPVKSYSATIDSRTDAQNRVTTIIGIPTQKRLDPQQECELEFQFPRDGAWDEGKFYERFGLQRPYLIISGYASGEARIITPTIQTLEVYNIPSVTETLKSAATISDVAYRLGIRTEELIAINSGMDLQEDKIIEPGTIITIQKKPCGQSIGKIQILGTHQVQQGEWHYCIARAYRISPLALVEANGLQWPYYIYPGQILRIPAIPWYNIPPGQTCAPQFSPPAGWPPQSPSPSSSSTEQVSLPTSVSPTDLSSLPALEPTKQPRPTLTCRALYLINSEADVSTAAAKYGVTIQSILTANNVDNVTALSPGTNICIP